MDVIPNGKWFVSTYLFHLVELVKTFPLIWVPTAKMDVCGYTVQQRQSHKNLNEALNQLASLRIVIAFFNME